MADSSRTVKIEILGDAANAVKALSSMEESGNKLETSVGKNHESIKSSGEGMEKSLAKNSEGIKESGSKVEESLKGSSEATSDFIKEAVKRLAELAAAGEVLNQVKEAVSTAEELGQATLRLTRETGMSAEASSSLLAAMERYGITGEEASKSLGNFSKQIEGSALGAENLEGGLTGTADRLKQMGIQVLDVNGKTRPMSDLLSEVADKFHAMPDGAEKTAIAMQLFGKAGKDMIPILDKGSEGLQELQDESKKLGLTLSGDNVEQIEKFRLASVSMNEAIGGVKLQLGVALMPLLTDLAHYVIEAAEAFNNKAVPAIKEFGSAISKAFGDISNGNVKGAIDDLFGGIITKVEGIAGKMFGAGTNITKTFAQGLIEGAKTDVKDAVNFVSSFIADFFIGHSPPPEGPLSQIDKGGETLGKTYVAGIKQGVGGISDVAQGVSDTLSAAQEKFASVAGNLNALKEASANADDAVLSLNHSINAIDEAEAPIKENMQDITNAYQDQIDPLQRQLDLIKQQVDYTNQQKELSIDLQDLELQKQENALKPQAAALDKQIKDLENQQKGIGKGGPDFQAEMTRIQREMRDLGNSAADAAKRKDLQRQLDSLNDQQTDSRNNDQKQKDIIQQQIDALRDKKDALDDGLKTQRDSLATQKETLALEDKEKSLKQEMLTLPLQQQIDGLKQGEQDALDPLKASLQVMDRRKAQLDAERASWGLLKQDIADAMKPLEAAKTAASKPGSNTGQGLGLAGDESPDGGQASPVEDAMQKTGQAAAGAFLKGVETFIKDHIGHIVGSAIGSALGSVALTPFLGPLGPVVGGILGGLIGTSVEKKLKESGVDFKAVAEAWGEKLKELGDFILTTVVPALEKFGAFVRDNVLPPWKEAVTVFEEKAIPALKQLAEGFIHVILPAVGAFVVFFVTEVMPRILEFESEIYAKLIPLLGKLADWFDQTVIPAIKRFAEAVIPAIQKFVTWLQDTAWPEIKQIIDQLIEAWKEIEPKILPAIQSIADKLGVIFGAIAKFLSDHGEQIKTILGTAWHVISDLISAAIDIIKNVIKLALDLISGNWSGAWEDIKGIVKGVMDAIGVLLTAALLVIANLLHLAWDGIKTVAVTDWKALLQAIADIVVDIQKTIRDTIQGAKDDLYAIWVALGRDASNAWNAVKTFFENAAGGLKDALLKPFRDFKNEVGGFLTGIPGVGGIVSGIGGFVGSIPHAANGAFVTSPTLILSGEGHDAEGEITSPVGMLRKVIREEAGGFGKGITINQNISGLMPEDAERQTRKALRRLAVEMSV